MKSELKESRALIGRLHSQLSSSQDAARSENRGSGDREEGLTEDDMMDAGDAEIAQLIARNAKNLKEIRSSIMEARQDAEREEEFAGMFDVDLVLSNAQQCRTTARAAVARPSTADPRMRSSFGGGRSSSGRSSSGRSSSGRSSSGRSCLGGGGGGGSIDHNSTSPGSNLIGRSLSSEQDVSDAKLAIRKAQMDMQRYGVLFFLL